MRLPVQDFPSLVRTQAAAAKASCRQLLDVTVGSALRAILEANASVGLWVQWLILEVLSMTRAATSAGADLDSWVADFGLARLPASAASGTVRLGRSTAGLSAQIPVGALVRTGFDGSDEVFAVAADPTHGAWNGTGYRLDAAEISIQVPVVAQTPGQGGNVQAGSIRYLASAIPGVDQVTNDGPMLGGLDSESDDALRTRFAGFLDSRSRATPQAVGFAIASLQQGLSYTISERVDTAGNPRSGHFTVTVDDGTGVPSPVLIGRAVSAIDAVRPIGGTFSVRAPLIVRAEIRVQILGPVQVQAAVKAAVIGFVSGLPIGAPLVLSKLYQIAHEADSAVLSVQSVTINGAGADLNPPSHGLIRPAAVEVGS